MNKERFEQIKNIKVIKIIEKINLIKVKISMLYSKVCQFYFRLTKKQRFGLVLAGIVVLLLLVIGFSKSSSARVKYGFNKSSPVYFEKKPRIDHRLQQALEESKLKMLRTANLHDGDRLKAQIDGLQSVLNQQYMAMKNQLAGIAGSLSSLSTQQAVNVDQLKQSVSKPNKQLLDSVSDLQSTLEKIVNQTQKMIWVTPESVERYFKLVAVQGFSDGMRAIIDVNGNEAALSQNEICPACRGWVLQSMDFTNQSAVFKRLSKGKAFYVKLKSA